MGDVNQMLVSSVVHKNQPHIFNRGDGMERKYDATYRFPGSKAVVHVVAPPPMSKEEFEKRLREFHRAGWAAWNSIPVDKRLKINLGIDLTKILQKRLQALILGQLY